MKAGIYKVTISQDTGPLAGVIKGELEITIQDPSGSQAQKVASAAQ
jgi:hypothetical protein